jgi:hypothetical protein
VAVQIENGVDSCEQHSGVFFGVFFSLAFFFEQHVRVAVFSFE